MDSAEVPEGGTSVSEEECSPEFLRKLEACVLDGKFSIEHKTSLHQSPLPPLDELRALEKILPGGTDRILRMAEKEQIHRHGMEWAEVKQDNKGINYAFLLVLVALAGGIAMILCGHQIVGTIFASATGIASIASLFIQVKRKSLLEDKDDQDSSKNNVEDNNG